MYIPIEPRISVYKVDLKCMYFKIVLLVQSFEILWYIGCVFFVVDSGHSIVCIFLLSVSELYFNRSFYCMSVCVLICRIFVNAIAYCGLWFCFSPFFSI